LGGAALYVFGYGLIVVLTVLSSAADFAQFLFVLSPFLHGVIFYK
jgi:hypothetical protein